MASDTPELVVLAGPNGGGKSSFQDIFLFPGVFINADLNARKIDPDQPERVSLPAGREVLRRITSLFHDRETFSSESSLKIIMGAKERGYRILLVFIALATIDLHVLRVRQRVQLGGHDIPEDVIRRRYSRCFHNLGRAIPLCDAVLPYDNSGEEPAKKLELVDRDIVFTGLDPTHPLDHQFHACVSSALDIDPGDAWINRSC
ncbi:putative ABC-type ATPase [Pararhizobium capsulatum DSM 1112]|uniref:ABC-type ATPase n=1 Tax=Pararhizobium capsulatum DSM 1112 TaxID=1121113 RepID=A0ABU0BSI2_9HYPH|nr:hypothetical protein [Pararhizobium capsulatum]MDQ0320601.1 putative ABC-type ATPase [Pararhizobium capsulatum DSM 1112]